MCGRSVRSDTALLLDEACEFPGPVEQVQRCEIVDAADVILAPLAGAEENAGVVARRRLGHLHVDAVGVERDFARNGDAGLIGAQIVGVTRQAERGAEQPEPAAALGVERTLGLGVIGAPHD